MKDIIKNLKITAKNRLMLIIMVIVAIFGIIFFATAIAGVKPFDQLIYVRYTAFGGEHYYKDAWFVRIFFASLGLFVATAHNLIISKIYATSGRKPALFFAGASIFLTIVGFFVSALMWSIPN